MLGEFITYAMKSPNLIGITLKMSENMETPRADLKRTIINEYKESAMRGSAFNNEYAADSNGFRSRIELGS